MGDRNGHYGRLNSNHQELYDLIREDNWKEIIKWITTSPMMITLIVKAPKEIIKEPLLHILIEYDQTALVLEVISQLQVELESDPKKKKEVLEVLEAKNFNNDTALHVAAAKGNKQVAIELIDSCDIEILNMMNKDGEIPLHRAALNGKSEMFYELLGQGSNYKARRSDGATVLHCAVMAYHFDLACKIIKEKPDLIFARDQLGLTPLHHMVSIPDAFRSGCDLSVLDSLLYNCIIMENSITESPKTKRSSDEENPPSSLDMASEVHENQNEGHMQDDQPNVEEKKLLSTYGQWVRRLVNNMIAYCEGRGRAIQSDPEAGEDDHYHHSFFGHHSELSHDHHSKKHRLFGSNIGGDETHGKSNVFSKILKPTTKWIQKQVYNFMIRTKYGTKLIDLQKKHTSAMNLLSTIAKNQDYWLSLSFGSIPESRLVSEQRKQDTVMERWMETPLTLAATLGLNDLVTTILERHPAAATYRGKEGKNLLHVAVENRQETIVNILNWIGEWNPRLPLRLKSSKDDNGNTILHLACMCNNQPSSPSQMSKEFKWFEKVKDILPNDLVNHRNKDGKTAKELFTENHAKMVEDAKTQLRNTAGTCCSALVTAVTFAAGFSIANDSDKKLKNADHRTKFVLKIFSHTYMFGLSCTAMALVQFMALLMASYKEEDFRRSLPTQYNVALATLFTAMVAMVVAFACNTYIGLYNELNPNWRNYLYLAMEVLVVPLICLIVMWCGGVKFRAKRI